MERKIGEKFIVDGKTYIVEKGYGCTKCAFFNFYLCDKHDIRGDCFRAYRSDETNVIFKEVIVMMKEFNLEEAKAGKPVCTRDGRKARIICFDMASVDLPIVALVKRLDNTETIASYDENGCYYGSTDGVNNVYDLMMVSEKKKGWINMYRNEAAVPTVHIYPTEEDALHKSLRDKDYIGTFPFEWEE